MATEGIRAVAEYLQKEGRVIKDAPIAFLVGVAFLGVVIFAVLDWHYSGEVATQSATIENQKSHIAVLEEENKGVQPQQAAINAKRKALVEQLEKFYVESTPLLNANLPKDISAADFSHYQQEVNEWVARTSKWIQQNMGEPARDRFLDYGQGFSFNWNRAVNEQHNGDINLLGAYRKNLATLIETNAWDRLSPN
jgi:hypothetical protein